MEGRPTTRTAKRLDEVPPYLFAELDRQRDEALKKGIDVISFGIGDPDQPTAPTVVETLIAEAKNPQHHRYPPYEGLPGFRRAVASYYQSRFGVALDPDTEVITAIGSKEGIAHLIWAYVEAGDVSLVPDPAYPVYATQTRLAGGEVVALPLLEDRGFLPDLDAVPEEARRRAKLLFLNYPNNPTGATADLAFFERAVTFARDNGLLLVSDAAYVEMSFGKTRPPSILEVPGAKDVAVEFYSLSKPFNMTGWRLGAMVGQREAVHALGVIKNNTDTGQFGAIQMAGETALTKEPDGFFRKMNALYAARRDLLVGGLRKVGWDVPSPQATFYVWAKAPGGNDVAFSRRMLADCGILVTPGSGYGVYGRGYVRLSLTLDERRIEEALDRIVQAPAGLLRGR